MPRADTRSTVDRDSEGLLRGYVSVVHRGFAGPSFSMTDLTGTLYVNHDGLCAGFGRLINLPPGRFVLGVGLRRTVSLLGRRPRLGVSRMSVRIKFSSPHCFDGLFGGFFKVAPRDMQKGKREASSVWAPFSFVV